MSGSRLVKRLTSLKRVCVWYGLRIVSIVIVCFCCLSAYPSADFTVVVRSAELKRLSVDSVNVKDSLQ